MQKITLKKRFRRKNGVRDITLKNFVGNEREKPIK